jgi:hypothetical protein
MMLYLPPFCAQNFMGIEHFAATMAPGINILQGDDGSAVLQAIRFCLSNTYELTEEQIGLIRQEWHCATEVAITLYNTKDAFEYTRYGPSVTVKRLLGQQGATALQLISDAGERITCDKGEVRSLACIVFSLVLSVFEVRLAIVVFECAPNWICCITSTCNHECFYADISSANTNKV